MFQCISVKSPQNFGLNCEEKLAFCLMPLSPKNLVKFLFFFFKEGGKGLLCGLKDQIRFSKSQQHLLKSGDGVPFAQIFCYEFEQIELRLRVHKHPFRRPENHRLKKQKLETYLKYIS